MTHGTLNLSKRSLCCPYFPLTMTAISLLNVSVFSFIGNLITKYLSCLKMFATDILVLFVILIPKTMITLLQNFGNAVINIKFPLHNHY